MLRPFQWWPTIRNLVEYQHFRIILLSLLTIDWNSPWYRVRHCFLNAVQTPHLPYMQSWNKPQSQQQGSWLLSWTYRAICLGPWDRVHQALPLLSPYLRTRTGNTWQWFQNESVWIKQQQKHISHLQYMLSWSRLRYLQPVHVQQHEPCLIFLMAQVAPCHQFGFR